MSALYSNALTTEEKVAKGWERSDFPIVDEQCLGDNPSIRMSKAQFDAECKLCGRPCTVFRWKSSHKGKRTQQRQTLICQTCAKLKNLCQACCLDLEFHLPAHIRDRGVQMQRAASQAEAKIIEQGAQSQNAANREWYLQQAEQEMEGSGGRFGRTGVQDVLAAVDQLKPLYAANFKQPCALFLRGQCQNGDACPFAHKLPDQFDPEQSVQPLPGAITRLPATGPNASTDANARGAGMAARNAHAMGGPPPPPEDESIKTLYVGGVDAQFVTEQDLRGLFTRHGMLEAVRMVPRKHCAFVVFQQRAGAESAMAALHADCRVQEQRLRVAWGGGASGNTAQKRKAPHGDASAHHVPAKRAAHEHNPMLPMPNPMAMPQVPPAPVHPATSTSTSSAPNAAALPPLPPPPGAAPTTYSTLTASNFGASLPPRH